MFYRVTKDKKKKLWPDGSVRALTGEVFDGLNEIEPREAKELAMRLLAPFRGMTQMPKDYSGPVVYNMPPAIEKSLRAAGWVPDDKWEAHFKVRDSKKGKGKAKAKVEKAKPADTPVVNEGTND